MKWLLPLAFVCGCGAFGDAATPLPERTTCPTLETRISHLLQLVDDGKLPGLQSAVAEDIGQDSRVRLVDAVLHILKALPAGTFETLKPLVDSGALDAVGGPLGDAMAAVVELGDPGYYAIGKAGTLLTQCTGKPLLATLNEMLGDAAFRANLLALLAPDSGLSDLIKKLNIDFTKVESRAGFVALLKAIVASLSQPSFDVEHDLIGEQGLLGLLGDRTKPPLSILSGLLGPLLQTGPRLTSVQLVTTCLLTTDPNDELFGLVFDVLHAGAIKLGGAPAAPAPQLDVLGLIDTLGRPILGVLVNQDSVRASLVVVTAALLSPAESQKVVPDLVVIFREGVLSEVMDLLVTLATHSC